MRKLLAGVYIVVGCFLAFVFSVAVADALQSTNFRLNEPSLGGLGNLKSQSTNFQASTSGGILGIDNGKGTTMQVDNGHSTTNDPTLAFGINAGAVNFGTFSATVASVTSSTFEVRDYTSYGYIVQILGTPPTNGAHTISAMATTGVSAVGTEQFGINMVANTSPASVGANPDHGQFGFGSATPNYGTTNNYRFVTGETIVSAPKSSGTTIYTISYMVNVDSLTLGGLYTSNQTLLCTATF